jgi:hypothetical protein
MRARFAALTPVERKALTLSVFAAGCICFAPAEIISGVLLLTLAYVLYRWDTQILAAEAAASPAPETTGGDADAPGSADVSPS